VTIYLKDVDVFDALRVILEMNHLAYTMEGAAARVMTEKAFEERFGYPFSRKVQTRMVPLVHARPDTVEELLNTMKSEAGKVIYSEGARSFILIDTPEQLDAMEALVRKMDVPVETRAFDLRYRKAKDIAPQVQGVLTKNVGRVEFGEGEHKMIVTDTSSGLDTAARKVEELDQPEEEVLFEVKILQIILNEEYREGVDWGAIVSDYQSVAFAGFGVKEGKGALSLGTVNEEDYAVLLDALDTVGAINTVSNLKLTASAGKANEILIRSSDLISDFDPGERLPAATGKRDVLYRVTPDIGKGGEVTLDIRPEVFGGAAAGADKGVEFKAGNGATVVIGGLFKKATVEATRKIPLLGDLPFLGFAFRMRGERFCDTEIIVFLTPKVIVKE
jgi:type II secretory pathway component GspD/PulD (secretin)